MKHSNISVFIPHIGCPHRCSFCDQRTISGASHAPTGEEVRAVCEKALGEVKSPDDTEIAFFGGSFTAIPRDYMTELLGSVQSFIGEGKFKGIRISTRPDCIDREVLDILKGYGVTSIELGAQSMSDKVLEANERGHSSEDVVKACGLIREYGFELGLQMMIGLYGSSAADEAETMEKFIGLHPDTVRIYPVVILKNTRLGELYLSGKYKTFTFDEVVNMASAALKEFDRSGIRVIKCGLHASEFVEQDMVGGFYHPAFRELCEGRIYRYDIEALVNSLAPSEKSLTLAVAPNCISKAMGHKRSNIEYFKQRGITLKIIGDESVLKYQIEQRR